MDLVYCVISVAFVDEEVRLSQYPNSVYDGDTLYITCIVGYSGLLAPAFVWNPSPDNVLPPVVNASSSVNSTVGVMVTSPVVQPYTCSVSFSGSISPYAPNKTSQQVNTSGG